jgi:hypothetical protein
MPAAAHVQGCACDGMQAGTQPTSPPARPPAHRRRPCAPPLFPPPRHFELQLQGLEVDAIEPAAGTPFWASPRTVLLRASVREAGAKFPGEGRAAGAPFQTAAALEAVAEWGPDGWRLVALQPVAPLAL